MPELHSNIIANKENLYNVSFNSLHILFLIIIYCYEKFDSNFIIIFMYMNIETVKTIIIENKLLNMNHWT